MQEVEREGRIVPSSVTAPCLHSKLPIRDPTLNPKPYNLPLTLKPIASDHTAFQEAGPVLSTSQNCGDRPLQQEAPKSHHKIRSSTEHVPDRHIWSVCGASWTSCRISSGCLGSITLHANVVECVLAIAQNYRCSQTHHFGHACSRQKARRRPAP